MQMRVDRPTNQIDRQGQAKLLSPEYRFELLAIPPTPSPGIQPKEGPSSHRNAIRRCATAANLRMDSTWSASVRRPDAVMR
jgi:hypothetical protein